jgi:hypothetical protein
MTILGYRTFEELAKHDLSRASYEAGYPRREFQERIEREFHERRSSLKTHDMKSRSISRLTGFERGNLPKISRKGNSR